MFDEDFLNKGIELLAPELLNNSEIQKSLNRVRNGETIQYLENKAKGSDQKISNYAKEVLRQIKE